MVIYWCITVLNLCVCIHSIHSFQFVHFCSVLPVPIFLCFLYFILFCTSCSIFVLYFCSKCILFSVFPVLHVPNFFLSPCSNFVLLYMFQPCSVLHGCSKCILFTLFHTCYVLYIPNLFCSLYSKLGKFTMVSQPIGLGWLVVGLGSIDLLLVETLIEFR